jgi:Flp pilus assembly protein TadG
LLTILLGVWDVGRLVDVYQILSNAAREGGRCASTGQLNVAGIQEAVLRYLKQALPPATDLTEVTVTVTNLTNAANTDPSTSDQLDQFQIKVTLPSNSVRWIVMQNLIGSQTLESTSIWNSMRDIPLTVSTDIPVD